MSILLDASRHTLPAVELTNRLSVRVSSAGQSYLHRCFRPIGEDDRSVALKAKLRRNIFRAAPDVGRIEAERGRWGPVALRRFSPSLIEPDVPFSGIRLSEWFHREARAGTARGSR